MEVHIATSKAAEQLLHKLALVNQIGQELSAMLDLHQVAERLLQAATETTLAEASSLWLWDEDRPGWLICRAAFDNRRHRSPLNLRLPPEKGLAGWVARHRESIVVDKAADDPRFWAEVDEQIGFQTVSLLVVPLVVREAVVGVLEVVNKRAGRFEAQDQALVETLATSAAIALDNARLIETLRQQASELQARNEELDAFAQTVAHDLQHPLSIIVGFADLLYHHQPGLPPEDIRKHLWTILRHGRKASNIINELLLLASLRTREVELQPLDMAGIVAEALQRLSYMIEESQARITPPPTWPAALGHSSWVEEVWVNYLSNGIKYGGQPPALELGAAPQPDGYVRFWVRDNGPGLKPAEQAQLFRPFTRFDRVRAGGHGLGLSIVRRIVEKLGGAVGVESKVGQGSIFTFTLPGEESQ